MSINVYGADSAISIPFDLVRSDGTPIVAQTALYTLLDKSDNILIAEAAVSGFLSTNTTVSIAIPAINNGLPQGKLSDARKLILKLTTSGGEVIYLEKIYLIQSAKPISFMNGSYQTLQEAELVALGVLNLDAFSAATSDSKIAALKDAFNRLGMMTFSVNYNYNGGVVEYVTEFNTQASGINPLQYGRRSVIISDLNLLPIAYISSLPENFIEKLKIAQVIEADVILGGDSVFDKRKDGLLSETVGESSTMWRQGKPSIYPHREGLWKRSQATFITVRRLDEDNTFSAIDACLLSVNSIYKLFITSIVGEFHKNTSFGVSKLSARDFLNSASAINKSATQSMNTALNFGIDQIASTLGDNSASFQKLKQDLITKLENALQTQMLLNIQSAKSDVFRYALAVTSRIESGSGRESAIVAANKSTQFVFIDKAGKKWNSERYVSTVTRAEIISAIYFSFVLEAETAGATKLLLSDQRVIDIADVEQYSHPNTKAIPIQIVK